MLFTRTRCLPRDPGPRIMTRVKKTTPPPEPTHPQQPPRVAVVERGGPKCFLLIGNLYLGCDWAATAGGFFKNTRSPV